MRWQHVGLGSRVQIINGDIEKSTLPWQFYCIPENA
jgi:hypothetical protein